jgi:hypothetical protein
VSVTRAIFNSNLSKRFHHGFLRNHRGTAEKKKKICDCASVRRFVPPW